MKNIRIIAIILSCIVIIAHVGCMNTKTAAPGGLEGTVQDSSGKAISGAIVSTPERQAYTDVYGKWALESLTAGITQVTATHEGYQTVVRSVEVVSGSVGTDMTFVMSANSEINTVVVSEQTSTQAKITYNSKYASAGYIEYGINGLLDQKTVTETTKLFSHSFVLTELIPATTYRFRCVAQDEYGRTIKSEVQTFTTSFTARPEPPSNFALNLLEGGMATQLTWDNDTGTDFVGFNVYRSTSIQGPFKKINPSYIPQGSFGDSGLIPGIKYYYRVTRVAGSGAESSPSNTLSILIPGYLTQNVTWTAAESPYILSGDLYIPAERSLIIDKGVTIKIQPTTSGYSDGTNTSKVDIGVEGTLMIQGTEAAPVSITSNASSPRSGDWQGIIFITNADLTASIIKGLKLSHAVTGVRGISGGPNIRESTFVNCSEYGVNYTNGIRDFSIRNSEFEDCTTGISFTGYTAGKLQVYDNSIKNCSTGIVSIGSATSEISGNSIYKSLLTGIKVNNKDAVSFVKNNVIGWGSSGTGILCAGSDEIRRNTIHCNVCIEALESNKGIYRSNLMLADGSRNCIGFLYTASKVYNSTTTSNPMTIEYNAVWDTTVAAKKYRNGYDESALSGYTNNFIFNSSTGPGLVGGDPFILAYSDMNFDYQPANGSTLYGAGYNYETIGAYDVAD